MEMVVAKPSSLRLIPVQPMEVIECALRANPDALQFVAVQTEDVCAFAIGVCSDAYLHVREPTDKLRELATRFAKQQGSIIQWNFKKTK
jgi:hypothetical protein